MMTRVLMLVAASVAIATAVSAVEAPDLPADLKNGRCYLPASELAMLGLATFKLR